MFASGRARPQLSHGTASLVNGKFNVLTSQQDFRSRARPPACPRWGWLPSGSELVVALPHERRYVRRKQTGEIFGEARKRFVAVPKDGKRHGDWLAAQFQSSNAHTLALAPERRRHNGDPMAGFGYLCQRTERGAFEHDRPVYSGDPAGRVKCLARRVSRGHDQQRSTAQRPDVDGSVSAVSRAGSR